MVPNTSTGLTEFAIPTSPSNPENIRACGNTLWFTQIANNTGSPARIASVDKISNAITEYIVDSSSQSTYGLVIDGNRNPWTTNPDEQKIYSFDVSTSSTTIYETPTIPHELALSPTGDLWYTDIRGHVVRMTPDVPLSPACDPLRIPPTSIITLLSSSTISIGGSVTDAATLSGNTADAGGSVTYNIYSGNQCTGTPVFISTVTVTNGIIPSSAAFTPTLAGDYTAQAVYSGDAHNGGSTSECGTEPFHVPDEKRMTGGGTISTTTTNEKTKGSDKNTVSHGFELHCDVSQGPNNLEVNWSKGNKFHLDSLTTASCIDDPTIAPNPPAAGFDTYIGTGKGSYNGVSGATAEWTFTDAGEPGKNDFAKLVIRDKNNVIVLSVSGNLKDGNQQAHKN
jgi:hypothetical protein